MIYVIIGLLILYFIFTYPIILFAIVVGGTVFGIVKLVKVLKRARKGITKEQEEYENMKENNEKAIKKMQKDGKYEQYMEGQKKLREHYNILKETLEKLQELKDRDFNEEDIELIKKYVFVYTPMWVYKSLETKVYAVKYAIEYLTMPSDIWEDNFGKMHIAESSKCKMSRYERKHINECKDNDYYIYYMGDKYITPRLDLPVKVIYAHDCPVIKKVMTIKTIGSDKSERLVVNAGPSSGLTIFCDESEFKSKKVVLVSYEGQVYKNLGYDDQRVISYDEDCDVFYEKDKNKSESKRLFLDKDYRKLSRFET